MANVIKAPAPTNYNGRRRVFLAGSIDMGKATNWQQTVIDMLDDLDIDIYNPRRDDWDSTWEQSIDNPDFSKQVRWELNALAKADAICFVFDPEGPAPVTLLELGLFSGKENVVVFCPDGYWRKGNVDIVCDTLNIDKVDNLFDLVTYLRERLS